VEFRPGLGARAASSGNASLIAHISSSIIFTVRRFWSTAIICRNVIVYVVLKSSVQVLTPQSHVCL